MMVDLFLCLFGDDVLDVVDVRLLHQWLGGSLYISQHADTRGCV